MNDDIQKFNTGLGERVMRARSGVRWECAILRIFTSAGIP
jgi:hypothetical protein